MGTEESTHRRWIVAAVGLLLVGLALVVIDISREDRIAEGIRVEGVELGELTVSEAVAVVEDEIRAPLRRTIVAQHRDREVELPPAESRLEVDAEATAEAAAAEDRSVPGVRLLRELIGDRRSDSEVEPRIRYSREAVDAFIAEVADELDRDPRDADLEPSAEGLEVSDAREGFATDRDELRRRVVAALESPDRHRIDVPGDRRQPEMSREELAEQNPHWLTVDREGFELRYYRDLEQEAVYPISVGDVGHATPPGRYDISNKAVNPTWYVPEDADWAGDLAGEEIPPGPDNPIKERWLGIEDGIGIHGTDEEGSIGERASAGCIRMLVEDVIELYEDVPVGTPVYIG
jgi:hypothetical protein